MQDLISGKQIVHFQDMRVSQPLWSTLTLFGFPFYIIIFVSSLWQSLGPDWLCPWKIKLVPATNQEGGANRAYALGQSGRVACMGMVSFQTFSHLTLTSFLMVCVCVCVCGGVCSLLVTIFSIHHLGLLSYSNYLAGVFFFFSERGVLYGFELQRKCIKWYYDWNNNNELSLIKQYVLA